MNDPFYKRGKLHHVRGVVDDYVVLRYWSPRKGWVYSVEWQPAPAPAPVPPPMPKGMAEVVVSVGGRSTWGLRYGAWAHSQGLSLDASMAEYNRNLFLCTLGGYALRTQKVVETYLRNLARFWCARS